MKKDEKIFVKDGINFNSIDIQIILAIQNKALSVAELQEKVGVAYKNLLPHIKKLNELSIINIKDLGKGYKKEITLNYKHNFRVGSLILGLIDFFAPNTNKELYSEVRKQFLEQHKQ